MQKPKDVFISYSVRNARLAQEVTDACRSAGLEAEKVSQRETPAFQRRLREGGPLWEALAESRALIVVLSPSDPTPWILFTIGAAQAWDKPIFAIISDPAAARSPVIPSAIPRYSIGRIEDVIEAIKRSVPPLSEDDRSFLVKLYRNLGASVEELLEDAEKLDRLTKRFNKARGKTLSWEQLLTELLRMRKQDLLGAQHPRRRSRSLSDSA